MKKIIITLLVFFTFLNTNFAFDFSDTEAKRKFCEKSDFSENNTYDEKNDTCTEIYKSGYKEITHFKHFYCKSIGSLHYSYLTEKCLEYGNTYLYRKENFDYGLYIDSKGEYYMQLTDFEYGEYYVSKKTQKILAKVYKKFEKITKNKTEEETKVFSEKIIKLIEKKIKNTQNQKTKDALFLLKYEIENHYFRKIYACKGSYCNKWYSYSKDETYREILNLKDGKKLLLEYGDFATFGCYSGKTILRTNGKDTIIIDDRIEYSKNYALCSVKAQVVDDDNVRLFVCIGGGGGSGECISLVFNLNLDTEKLTFIGDWYYIPEQGFDMYAFEQQKKWRQSYIPNSITDIKENLQKNKDSEDYKRELEYLQKLQKSHKIIKEYFKKEHNIDIPYIEGDEYIKLIPNK